MSAGQAARQAHFSAATLTAGLWLFLLIGILAPNALLWLAAPAPYNETALHHTWDMLNGRSVDDSWGVMMSAVDYLKNPGKEGVYSELFFNRGQRFQYPLSSLFALEGMLHLVGIHYVRTSKHIVYNTLTINDAIGWAFIVLAFASTCILMERALKQAGLSGDKPWLMALRALSVLALTITFYPIVKAYTLGQIQVWINGVFALALLLWAYGWRATSGFLIGAIVLVKPHFGLFLAWAVLRREWRFVLSLALTVAFGLAMSIAVYGLANHLDYFRVLRELSQTGELYYPNQSVNGVLNRLLSLSDPTNYNSTNFAYRAPYNIWVRGATLLAAAFFLLVGWLFRAPDSEVGRARTFALMGLCITLASPVAWEHHYGITLPMFALLLATANAQHLIWLGASYVLIALYVPVTNMLAATPLNVLQSMLFVGAMILFVLLWRSWSPEAREPVRL